LIEIENSLKVATTNIAVERKATSPKRPAQALNGTPMKRAAYAWARVVTKATGANSPYDGKFHYDYKKR
jgi:hypothetical protein